MCDRECLQFAERHLTADRVAGRRVLEVGARDINGTVRPLVEQHGPAEYIGIDIEKGPGVDEICDICGLVERFGEQRFDVVVCTEVIEHVRDWRSGLSNLKRVLAPGGVMLITTRSIGFHYHGYPRDFWRYQVEDIKSLTADMTLDVVESATESAGVLFVAIRPNDFQEASLAERELHSIVTGRRCRDIADKELRWFIHVKHPVTRFFEKTYRSIRKRFPGTRWQTGQR